MIKKGYIGKTPIIKALFGESKVWGKEGGGSDVGLAKDYSGTGWYKATDTGIVYNVGIPEGETHTFSDGDPIEYISVWRNEGFDINTFKQTPEELETMRDWQINAYRYATSNVTDMSYWMFAYGESSIYPPELGEIPEQSLAHYDVSNVTSLEGSFSYSSVPIDLGSNWNTSKLTNMKDFAAYSTSFNSDLSAWDTSSLTVMESAFKSASVFNSDISGWDVSNVTDMTSVFDNALLFNQDISSWDVSKVTLMTSMFYFAEAFNHDISGWDVSNVTSMESMFFGAKEFNQDISGWNVSNVAFMNRMFSDATSFNQDLSQWCVTGYISIPYGFDKSATSWTEPKPVWGTCPRGEDGSIPNTEPDDQGLDKDYSGTGWYKATDTGIVYNKGVPEGETHTFEGDPVEYLSVYTKDDAVVNLNAAATSNITDLSSAFFNEGEYKSTYSGQNLSHWDVSNVTNFEKMFFYAQAQDIVGVENWKTKSATNMARMFTMSTNFNSDISGWDVSNVTNMRSMFAQAESFNQDISGWNVMSVMEMTAMFNFATSFNQDLSQWCVRNISTQPSGWEGYENIVPPVWGTCPRGEVTPV